MYVPEPNRQPDPRAIRELIDRFGFATLVSHGPDGLLATPLPFLLDPARGGPHGTLRSHMARANPHWRIFASAAAAAEALVIFHGPHAYVSPAWYASPVAVPTWNYLTVHAYGQAQIIEDDAAAASLLADTVRHFESSEPSESVGGPGWSIDCVPADVAAGLRKQIVAFEIPITRLQAKWKLGQNRPAADRRPAGAILAASPDPQAAEIGRLMIATTAGSDGNTL